MDVIRHNHILFHMHCLVVLWDLSDCQIHRNAGGR